MIRFIKNLIAKIKKIFKKEKTVKLKFVGKDGIENDIEVPISQLYGTMNYPNKNYRMYSPDTMKEAVDNYFGLKAREEGKVKEMESKESLEKKLAELRVKYEKYEKMLEKKTSQGEYDVILEDTVNELYDEIYQIEKELSFYE